ncbi:hypothetical protein AMELA_G00119970, partial [Ameiurus melas]
AFFTGFLASVCFLFSLKEPDAPVPLVCTRVPLVTRALTASLTRELFFSTSYPPAASAFFRAARDTPLLSLDEETALTISSPTLGPTFFAFEAAFFLGALAGAAAGAGATSAISLGTRMYNCSITDEGCAALASALRSNSSSHLREFDLDYNNPGESGV